MINPKDLDPNPYFLLVVLMGLVMAVGAILSNAFA